MPVVESYLLLWLLLYALHRFGVLPTLIRCLCSSSSSSTPQSPSHSSSSSSLSISWYGLATFSTPLLNPLLHRIGSRFAPLLRLWFSPAPFTAIAGLLLALSLLLYNLLSLAWTYAVPWLGPHPASALSLAESNLLSIALPGVTVPLSSLPYLSAAVLLSVVCHEAGHALCAESVGQRVKRVGVFWLLFFPGAWVEVEGESDDDGGGADEADAAAQLTVVAAGVWHNAVLATLGVLLLLSLPYTLAPLYRLSADTPGPGTGITLLSVDGEVSPSLAASPLLRVGDRLTSVNGRPVGSTREWRLQLSGIMAAPQLWPYSDGRCLSSAALVDSARGHRRQLGRVLTWKGDRSWEEVNAAISRGHHSSAAPPRPMSVSDASDADQSGVVEGGEALPGDALSFACCVPEVAHHSTFLCFAFNSSDAAHTVCLQPRGLISSSSHLCRTDADCAALHPTSATSAPLPLEERLSCATPQHLSPDFHLIVIGRTAVSPLSSPIASSHDEVFFVGSALELLRAVRCTDYRMQRWLEVLASPSPRLFACLVALPTALIRLTQFTVAVSTSLFVLNCLPVPLSDGQHALALMAHVATEARGGREGGLLVPLLRATPRWVWEDRWTRRLRHFSVALFVATVALTLLPAVMTLAQALAASAWGSWLS